MGVLLGLSLLVALAPRLVPAVPWPWNDTISAVIAGMGVLYAIGLVRNEQGATQEAAHWLVAGILLGSWLPIFVPGGIDGPRSYAFIINNVLVAAFALSWRHGAGIAILDALVLTLVLQTRATYPLGAYLEDVLILVVVSCLILAFAVNGDRQEVRSTQDRRRLERTVVDIRALLDNSPDAMVTVTAGGEVLRLNHVAQDWSRPLLGRPLEAGDRLPDLLGDEWPSIASLLQDAQGSKGVSSEMSFPTQAGTRWYRLHLHPIEGTDCLAVQVRDVTRERASDMHDRAAYRDRVELEKLREIDTFRKRLLNTASHELRTPLTPLRLQLGVLEHRFGAALDERGVRSFQTIKRSIGRLTMLLDDLLDVARLEAGEMRIEPEESALATLVQGEVEAYASLARSRGVELRIDAPHRILVRVDPHRLAQVMSNLLSNAVKYADKEVTVQVGIEGNAAVVEVADDGHGFERSQAEELWQPFSQIQDDEHQREGTGLGLFISKGIIEAHGGSIWAASPGPGQGASFGFSLPLTAASRASLKYEGEAMATR